MEKITTILVGLAVAGCGGAQFSAGDPGGTVRDDAGQVDEGGDAEALGDNAVGRDSGQEGASHETSVPDAGPDQNCTGGYGICCPMPSVPGCVLGPAHNLQGAVPGCCMQADFGNGTCMQVTPPSACR
jgi:hypothetical protein